MSRLSILMIVRDEEPHLAGALDPLRGIADELIVVDTGSRDHTPQIARRLGAEVHHFPWCDDFSAARNFSIRRARGDWIFWLDADDRLTKNHARRLKSLCTGERDRAYFVILQGAESDPVCCHQLRLLPNLPGIQFEGVVHEQVIHSAQRLGLRLETCDVMVRHLGYADPAELRKKNQRNLALLKKALAHHPDDLTYRFQLCKTYDQLGQTPAAIQHLEQLLHETDCQARDPALHEFAAIVLGNLYEKSDEPAQAVAAYRAVLRQAPESALARFYLGRVELLQSRFENALPELKRAGERGVALSRFPVPVTAINAAIQLNLACCYESLGRFPEAEAAYERSLAIRPDSFGAHLALGALCVKTHKPAKALTALKEAQRGCPEGHYARGTIRELLAEAGRQMRCDPGVGRASVTYSPYEPARLSSVVDFWNRSFARRHNFFPVTEESFQRRVVGKDYANESFDPEGLIFAIGADGKEILGLIHAGVRSDKVCSACYDNWEGGSEGYIAFLYVAEPYRHQGIGSALLQRAREYLNGVAQVVIDGQCLNPFYGNSDGLYTPFWGTPEGISIQWDDEHTRRFLGKRGFEPRYKGVSLVLDLRAYAGPSGAEARLRGPGYRIECLENQHPTVGHAVDETIPYTTEHGYQCIVGVEDGLTVAALSAYPMVELQKARSLPAPPFAIYSFEVHPQHRGNGLGKALLQTLLDSLRQRQIGSCEALTLPEASPAAFHLYKEAGFQEVAEWAIY